MADKSCFVVMGYGQRRDPVSGKKVDLDRIYFEIIKPIAIECGYNNISYFPVCFKKKYGISPKTFITQRINNETKTKNFFINNILL